METPEITDPQTQWLRIPRTHATTRPYATQRAREASVYALLRHERGGERAPLDAASFAGLAVVCFPYSFATVTTTGEIPWRQRTS